MGQRRFLHLLAAYVLGDDDRRVPAVPEGLPTVIENLVVENVRRLTEYQNADYAHLYMSRVGRFVHRNGVDGVMLEAIARLLGERMMYDDLIWYAQRLLAQDGSLGNPATQAGGVVRPTLREIAGLMPESVAEPLLGALDMAGWTEATIKIVLTGRTWRGRIAAYCLSSLRRLRPMSVRYTREKALVERWLHMVDRALTKQPEAAQEIVDSAALLRGHGVAYGRALRNWLLIINTLAKPVFDGDIVVPGLSAQLARLRVLADTDRSGEAIRAEIAAIREQAARAA
jgi:hypothetical protein